ncbi:MAG: hypothetical protein JRE23_16285 [Deltaproteobacteria bacterium]|nr:hypothetical protein [Deltaproteobacteria bacterium]
MKKLYLIFAVLLLFGCVQPTDEIIVEKILEPENIPPVVKIIEGNQTIDNGADITLTTDITDPDNTIFLSTWSVNEIEINNQQNFTFAARPDRATDYKICVSVSDGEAECGDSVIITVLGPPWTPEKLHVYIFPVGAEMNDFTWTKHYTATDSNNYWTVMNGANLKVQEHNQFFPDDPWHYIGGGI